MGGTPTGSAYPTGHIFSSPFSGRACAPNVEIRFPELVMTLLDFSP